MAGSESDTSKSDVFSDVSFGENSSEYEVEAQEVHVGAVGGVVPYRFEPQMSSSDEDNEEDDDEPQSDSGDEAGNDRLQNLTWCVFMFCIPYLAPIMFLMIIYFAEI